MSPTSGQTMKPIKTVNFIHKNNGTETYDLKGEGDVKAFR